MRKDSFINFLRDEEGATAIEYGLVAGLVAVLLSGIFSSSGKFGGGLTSFFEGLGDYVKALTPKSS